MSTTLQTNELTLRTSIIQKINLIFNDEEYTFEAFILMKGRQSINCNPSVILLRVRCLRGPYQQSVELFSTAAMLLFFSRSKASSSLYISILANINCRAAFSAVMKSFS